MLRRNSGQSIVEYAILLGVIIAALLIMQAFIKRGYQGGLKDSADKMGEQFSAGNTTIKQARTMAEDQTIREAVATDDEIALFTGDVGIADVPRTLDAGAYSYSERSPVEIASTTHVVTDSADQEATRKDAYANVQVTNFQFVSPDSDFERP
ncbi:MAG: hypothetical protein WC532_08755 [Candidatus Omnitrophota bacterium]